MKRTISAFILFIMELTTVGCANSNESQGTVNNTPSSSIANSSSNTDVAGNISTDTITLTSEVTKLENGLSAVKYSGDYRFDDFLSQGGASSDSDVVAFLSENVLSSDGLSFGGVPFGCSTISAVDPEGNYIFGRNFDWNSCNAMIVHSVPENGYASISTVNTDFINMSGLKLSDLPDEMQAVICMYAPVDGMNEKGLAVSVNMIQDSAAISQNTDKPDITTTTAIRLLLDKAANADEAINLLGEYDMHASMDFMMHIAIADLSGKSAVIEYVDNEMIVTETPVVTNFYLAEGEKHGIGTAQSHERYDILMNVLSDNNSMTMLVFFASLTGRMNSWLGGDGKGMMDAFNPADHDIGVQVFGDLTAEEAEEAVRRYSEITDTYLLAMPGIAVNGVDYTANVISEPQRFHILKGKTCMSDNEIVLTEFVAAHFGVEVGDTVTVQGDSGSGEYIVSGIYSCANDMGDNVGMSREGYLKIGIDNPHIWCWHYFLEDPSQKTAITEALETAYGGDVHVHENTWPGLFGIISAMHALIAAMYALVIVFILVVTVMTSGKLLSSEQKDLGIYKAIGFGTNTLRLTFAVRFGIVAFVGSAIGTILAALLTDPLVSAVMKLAGISNFSSSPSAGSIVLPSAIVISLFFCFAYFAAGKIKKIALTVLIAE